MKLLLKSTKNSDVKALRLYEIAEIITYLFDQYNIGEMTKGTYNNLRGAVNSFAKFLSENAPQKELDFEFEILDGTDVKIVRDREFYINKKLLRAWFDYLATNRSRKTLETYVWALKSALARVDEDRFEEFIDLIEKAYRNYYPPRTSEFLKEKRAWQEYAKTKSYSLDDIAKSLWYLDWLRENNSISRERYDKLRTVIILLSTTFSRSTELNEFALTQDFNYIVFNIRKLKTSHDTSKVLPLNKELKSLMRDYISNYRDEFIVIEHAGDEYFYPRQRENGRRYAFYSDLSRELNIIRVRRKAQLSELGIDFATPNRIRKAYRDFLNRKLLNTNLSLYVYLVGQDASHIGELRVAEQRLLVNFRSYADKFRLAEMWRNEIEELQTEVYKIITSPPSSLYPGGNAFSRASSP